MTDTPAHLQIGKPKERAPIITILAGAGLGKTTLASLFPKPIFLRTEDGMQAIPEAVRPDAFPVATSGKMLIDQLRHLYAQPVGSYLTLVLDSITPLDAFFISQVLKEDQKQPRTINQALGGYGAGMKAVARLHQDLMDTLVKVIKKHGMTLVIIAHSTVERLDPPDGESFTKYGIRLAKESVAPWIDQVDMVAFIQLQKIMVGEDKGKKKAKSFGQREIICHSTAANDSKNRYGIAEAIDYNEGENPLLAVIPYYAQNGLYTAPGTKAKPKAKAVEPEPEVEQEPETPQVESEFPSDASDFM